MSQEILPISMDSKRLCSCSVCSLFTVFSVQACVTCAVSCRTLFWFLLVLWQFVFVFFHSKEWFHILKAIPVLSIPNNRFFVKTSPFSYRQSSAINNRAECKIWRPLINWICSSYPVAVFRFCFFFSSKSIFVIMLD